MKNHEFFESEGIDNGLLLESGRIDLNVLSNALEYLFGEKKETRSRGTGKQPNSPMLI